MGAEDEIDQELALISKKLDLTRKRQALAELTRQDRLSDDEYPTMESFVNGLIRTLTKEIEKMGSEMPTEPTVVEFARTWIIDNWSYRFRHLELTDSQLPRATVREALRALYDLNSKNLELRGEITELHNAYHRASAASAQRVTIRWREYAAFWTRSRPPKGVGKRASELRAERRQHAIQRYFSSIAVAFTFTTAAFMTAMLFVGGIHLYNAVADGVGIPFHIGSCPTWEGLATTENTATSRHEKCHIIDHESRSNPHEAMKTSLLALEIILVAPLPYLLVLGLTRYIKALAYQERATEFRRELLEFKAFEVALFIAIIAAAVVERAVRSDLSFEFSISVFLILTILAVYYFIIEKSSKAAEEEQPK